jgi:3-methyladenine DNA glycosylase AlkD
MATNDRWAARAGWSLTAERVVKSPDGLDLPALLDRIESEMKNADPVVQWTMNSTLAEIGIHVPELRKRPSPLAKRWGSIGTIPFRRVAPHPSPRSGSTPW